VLTVVSGKFFEAVEVLTKGGLKMAEEKKEVLEEVAEQAAPA
jgi:hypothetical protein